ncbi:MAG: hypothetical protein R2685_10680 [Candidatus Nitrosocosmicus sp.]|nr:hypothetical protein [Candidatus Nitrosocosmicus sp.]
MAGKSDKYGVVSRYATGQIKYDWNDNFRNDGLRFDFGGLGSSFASCELIGYFKVTDDVDDEVSGKMGGGKHSSGSRPRCYDMGVDINSGDTRYRTEDKHPEYDDGAEGSGDAAGGGIGCHNQFVGFNFIKRNLSNGVLLEIWQDQGNNEGNSDGDAGTGSAGAGPANQWKCIASWVVTDPIWKTPPSDHQETLRIDEVSESTLEWKWISLREILDDDSDTPSTGGSDDDDTGGDGSGSGGTGDGSGNTGSGPSTPPPPPPPPPEVYQEVVFEMMWNINYKSGDPCNVNAPPEFTDPVEVFTSPGDDAFVNIPKDMKAAGWFINKDSVLIGHKLRAIKIFMKKEGSPLTGDIKINIYSGNNDLVDTFDTVYAVNALDANVTEYLYTRASPARVLQENDRVSIDWLGDGDTVNYIRVQITETDKVDSTATCLFITDDNQHIEISEPYDLAGSVYI